VEDAAPIAPEVLQALPGVSGVRRENGRVALTVGAVHATVPALLAELERRGLALASLVTHHATLEDVFVARTGRHLRDE
jgi:ABC-2 type transport system ATP-binding protein